MDHDSTSAGAAAIAMALQFGSAKPAKDPLEFRVTATPILEARIFR